MPGLLTVVTAATRAERRLCQIEALARELLLGAEVEAAAVLDLIDKASAAIASHCRRVLAEEVVSETFRIPLPDGHPLILSRTPVTAIASVLEDGIAILPADRELEAESGLLHRLRQDQRSAWSGKVVVEYTAGWRMPGQTNRTLPDDIERAAVLLAAAMHHARGRDMAVRSESVDGVASISYRDPKAGHDDMPAEVAGLLSRWRETLI